MAERILIVEDEEKLARFIELELLHEGYAVEKAADGRDGLEKAQAGGVDLVLLDVMLPGMSGMELLRRLRRASDVPVIMVTARDAVMDKVTGLDTGADDYITKPFEIEELLARIRAALRKRGGVAQGAEGLTCGALALDPARHTVAYNGAPIELTRREFDTFANADGEPVHRAHARPDSGTACGAMISWAKPMWWTCTSAICARRSTTPSA